MASYTFIATSAINTRFGIYAPEQRLEQTLATVSSIRRRVPNANVVLLEMAGRSPAEEHVRALKSAVDIYMDFTTDDDVRQIFDRNDNWDVVKNATEMLCFSRALRVLENNELLGDSARVFKVSGRYQVTDEFDILFYESPEITDRIVFKRHMRSQFPLELTQVPLQYMSRLWSFPAGIVGEIADTFGKMLAFMVERTNAGGYVDIEHCLYKFMDRARILEVDRVGVTGNLGATGSVIAD